MAHPHSLTEKEAKRVIQESKKSNQEIIKKALSKFIKLNNTTNTAARSSPTYRPVATSTNNRPSTNRPVATSTNNRPSTNRPVATNTNNRPSNTAANKGKSKSSKKERHWLGVLLELV